MGTGARLVTDEAGAGEKDLRRAEEDLRETERVLVGQFEGSPLAVATSTRRAWKADGKAAHHPIGPRTGEPSEGEFACATAVAPTRAGRV